MSRLRALGTLALAALCPIACERTSAPRGDAPVSNDVAALARLISWQAPPIEARWQVVIAGRPSRAPGPEDWSLRALLRYPPARVEALVAGARKLGDDPAVSPPEWVGTSLADAGAPRAGAPVAFSPDAFLRSPLLHGTAVALDCEHIYLVLHTQ